MTRQNLQQAGGVLAAVTLLIASAGAASDTRDYSRYQIVIDRSPFGAMPKDAQAPGVQPGFALNFSLFGIVQSNGDSGPVQAILEDKTSHKTYFKMEGETIGDGADAIKVTRIVSNSPESVVLVKGLETGTLTFGKPSSSPAPVPGMPAAVAPGPVPAPAMPIVVGQPQRRIPFRRGN